MHVLAGRGEKNLVLPSVVAIVKFQMKMVSDIRLWKVYLEPEINRDLIQLIVYSTIEFTLLDFFQIA